MTRNGDDIVSDLIERVEVTLRALGALPEAARLSLRKVEVEVRRDWGGDEVYVRKVGDRDDRKDAVRAEIDRGVPVRVAATRHGISRTAAYELLKRR